MSTLDTHGGPHALDLYELAMLSGGPDLAITTAGSELLRDGRVRAWSDGTLQAVAELGDGAHPLERATLEAVRRERGVTGAALRATVAGGAAIASMTDDLTRAGLLAEAGWARWRRLRATREGRELLAERRRERVDQRRHPIAAEGALSTALFGAATLWLVEPDIATALDVPREAGSGFATVGGFGWLMGPAGGGAAGSCGGHSGGGGGCGGGGGGGCGGGGGG